MTPMNLGLPRFDSSALSEFEAGMQMNRSEVWGWIGSVACSDEGALARFMQAAEKGDIATMKEFQHVARAITFAVARVGKQSIDIVVLNKSEEPMGPSVLGVWSFENKGVHIEKDEFTGIEHLMKATRLSWKEMLLAVIRSLK